jgi:hypothetical protein
MLNGIDATDQLSCQPIDSRAVLSGLPIGEAVVKPRLPLNILENTHQLVRRFFLMQPRNIDVEDRKNQLGNPEACRLCKKY